MKSLLATYRAGLGGPIGGGAFAVPWIHIDVIAGLYIKAIDDASWSGAYNGPGLCANRDAEDFTR